MMVNCTRKTILAEHAILISQRDQSTVQFVRCAFRSMIITAFGIDCSIQDQTMCRREKLQILCFVLGFAFCLVSLSGYHWIFVFDITLVKDEIFRHEIQHGWQNCYS